MEFVLCCAFPRVVLCSYYYYIDVIYCTTMMTDRMFAVLTIYFSVALEKPRFSDLTMGLIHLYQVWT